MLAKLFGGKATVTAMEQDLLDSIRDSAIPNPDVLRERLAALNHQIAAAEAEWEKLDRRGDAASFLHLQPIAEWLQALRAEATVLPAQIEAAEGRREAFLSLGRLFDSLLATVAARTEALGSSHDYEEALRALDETTRTLGYLAARLSIVSSAPQFRRVDDAVKVVRAEYELRIRACDLLRAPGMRPKLALPPAIVELLAAMENGERKTA